MKKSRAYTREGSARARDYFERAVELDPYYAVAYARLSMNLIFRWIVNWSQSREESIETGLKFAEKAVSPDGKLALAHTALC